MTRIKGIEGLSPQELADEIQRGGRFVVFEYCVSIVLMTFRGGSDVHYLAPGESALVKGGPFTLLSVLLGWWGVPWGLIHTPLALATNLKGGRDVTASVMDALGATITDPRVR